MSFTPASSTRGFSTSSLFSTTPNEFSKPVSEKPQKTDKDNCIVACFKKVFFCCFSNNAVQELEPSTFYSVGTTPHSTPRLKPKVPPPINDEMIQPLEGKHFYDSYAETIKRVCTTDFNEDDFKNDGISIWLGQCNGSNAPYTLGETISLVYEMATKIPVDDKRLTPTDYRKLIEQIEKLQKCAKDNSNLNVRDAHQLIFRTQQYIKTLQRRYKRIFDDEKLTRTINSLNNASLLSL